MDLPSIINHPYAIPIGSMVFTTILPLVIGRLFPQANLILVRRNVRSAAMLAAEVAMKVAPLTENKVDDVVALALVKVAAITGKDELDEKQTQDARAVIEKMVAKAHAAQEAK